MCHVGGQCCIVFHGWCGLVCVCHWMWVCVVHNIVTSWVDMGVVKEIVAMNVIRVQTCFCRVVTLAHSTATCPCPHPSSYSLKQIPMCAPWDAWAQWSTQSRQACARNIPRHFRPTCVADSNVCAMKWSHHINHATCAYHSMPLFPPCNACCPCLTLAISLHICVLATRHLHMWILCIPTARTLRFFEVIAEK